MINSSSVSARQDAIKRAQDILKLNPVYIDTETTGLKADDEIIEISIIDHDGTALLETLVKPGKPIPADATRVHGITDRDVQTARAWPTVVWPQVRNLLLGRVMVFYNAEFDIRMMRQSLERYKLPWKELWRENTHFFDLLKIYAQFRGEWDPNRRAYRYHSLAKAGADCNISLPNAHRTTADTLLTRALLHYVAESN